MLGRISKARHALVGLSIAGTSALAGFGVVGGGDHPERFDAKTIVVEPAGGDALRITEYVDQDFGHFRKHGYERIVPNNFGVPVDVRASSPDAPDDLDVTLLSTDLTRIRIGDPDTTITGQHRYRLEYVYPAAQLSGGRLQLNIVAPFGNGFPGDDETGRFEVIVTGFELGQPTCDTGGVEDVGGCELVAETIDGEPAYSVLVEPLPADDGLAIFADIVDVFEPVRVPSPDLPERRPDRSGALAGGLAAAGLAGAFPVYRWARRRGRNEVFAGGAADAAYGTLPPPVIDGVIEPPPPVRMVPDDEMADLATIEFVPPSGIDPWEGAVLLTEKVNDDTVSAWFSGLAAREAIELEDRKGKLAISSGPRRHELSAEDARLLDRFLGVDETYVTGKYDKGFASAWGGVRSMQRQRISKANWWAHLAPGSGFSPKISGSWFGFAMIGAFFLFSAGSGVAAFLGGLRSWPLAIAFGLVVPAVIAYFSYRALLPARSAQGSALALRAESFRRFLDASEGRHVEWAWKQGVLREYSAWAVALGEARAWKRALDDANVPAPARAMSGPLLIDSMSSSVQSTRTAPSSSGSSGGGGGFSGGGGGGGGGGGSSGSW